MSRAQQLPLTLSVADSVTVQLERDRAEAYAQEYYDRAQTLSAENDGLKARLLQVKTALQAAETRALELERDLLHAESMAESWRVLAERWRYTDLARPRHAMPSKEVLTHLVQLCHPDRWQGQPAETLAHEMAVAINALRSSKGGQA